MNLTRTFLTVVLTLTLSVQALAYPSAEKLAQATHAITNAALPQFSSETAAQAHCPNDDVVWLNTHSGIYHEKGMHWYARTKFGAYVCKSEADEAGDRETRNGQ